MKHTLHAFLSVLLIFVMVSCGGKDEEASESLLSGPSSKTWVANKELNAAGDKEKLSSAEKKETMQFYADGRFAMGGGGTLQTGTWQFDKAAKRLSLQFEGADVTENFEVEKLTDDKMTLKTPDGATMELEKK
ncbi:lipocalin family protein [Pontibacter sp. CAU 1760]